MSVETAAEKGLEARMPRRERVEMLTFDPYHAPRRRTEECIFALILSLRRDVHAACGRGGGDAVSTHRFVKQLTDL